MPARRDIAIGERFSRLEFVRELEPRVMKPKGYERIGLFLCDCGTVKEASVHKVLNGHTRSCGCLWREVFVGSRKVHGEAHKTKEYRCWQEAKKRCFNKNLKSYVRYGGRGITMCDRWIDSYENFLSDMGRAHSPHHSLDRIDNNGNYEPGNCRWATTREQRLNSRAPLRFLGFKGEIKYLSEWARELGFKPSQIASRLYEGWSIERALTTPIKGT